MAFKEVQKLQSVPAAFQNVGEKINEVIEFVKPLTKIEGKNGITVTPSDNNLLISWALPSGSVSASVASSRDPFTIYQVSGSHFSVAPGTVNDVWPHVGGDPVTDDPAPTFTVPTNTTTNVYVLVQTDSSFEITNCEIKTGSIASATSGSVGRLIGTVYLNGTTGAVTLNQSITNSLTYWKCGTNTHRFAGL